MAVKASATITLWDVSDGETGNGVSSVTAQYYISTSSTTQTGGSWVKTSPTWSSGKYMWCRNKITYTNGTIAYTTPYCDSSWTAVNEVQVGGRNLFGFNKGILFNNGCTPDPDNYGYTINTGSQKTSGYGWRIQNLGFNSIITDYTFSAYISATNDISIKMDICDKGKFVYNITSTPIKVVCTSHPTAYNTPSSYNGFFDVEWASGTIPANTIITLSQVKIERGNKATDWTPAPEDVDNKIDTTASVIQQSIEDQDANITKYIDSVVLDATDTYVSKDEYGEYKEKNTSDLEVLANRIDMNFSSSTTAIDNLSGTVSENFSEISKYIRFSEDGIEIGKDENSLKLSIDNDMIMFTKNGEPIGYWDGVDFHTGNLIVDVNERAQFGNFAFVPRSDGSLSFLKVKG